MDQKTRQVLIKFNRYKKIKNFLTLICYLIIFFGISLFAIDGFKKREGIKIINEFQANQTNFSAQKTMVNPRIILQYNQNDLYNIKAKNANHHNENEIILQDVLAEGNIGKISAGQLKITEDGNLLTFTNNPVLLLK